MTNDDLGSPRLGLFGDAVEDLEQDVVGIDSLGLGLEVQEDAMAQAGQIDAAQVLETDVVPAVEQGADLGGQDQGLDAAGAAPPSDILVGRLGGIGSFG